MKHKDDWSTYRKGLGRTLLSWFIGLSLLPLTIVGLIEYNNASNSITRNKHDELAHVNLLLSRQINNYHDSVITNLFFRAGQATDFLLDLKSSWEISDLPLREYLSGIQYQEVVDWHAREFVDFLYFFKYSDILLIDEKGNVLYTIHKYRDLGENLFDGVLADTRLSATVKQVLETGEPHYSDLEPYEPLGGEVVSFFVMPLINEERKVAGTIAVQTRSQDDLKLLLHQGMDTGDHVSSYIVGVDGKVRFWAEEEGLFYGQRINTAAVMDWLNHIDPVTGEYTESLEHFAEYRNRRDEHGEKHEHAVMNDDEHEHDGDEDILEDMDDGTAIAHIERYSNYRGDMVLGVYRHMEIMGTPMVLLTEVNLDDALMPVTRFRNQFFTVLVITSLVVLLISMVSTRRIAQPLVRINGWVNRVASGEYVKGEVIDQQNEIGQLSRSFSIMTEQLRRVSAENEARNWLQSGITGLNEALRGELSITELCQNTLSFMCRYLRFQVGAMYVLTERNRLVMMGSYAYTMSSAHPVSFVIGEGLPGQTAEDRQTMYVSVPDDYFPIASGLGSSRPDRVLVIPIVFDDNVKGVLEFGLLGSIDDRAQQFIDASLESIAIVLNRVQARERVQELLEQTTRQTEALTKQQDDLRTANQELEHQTRILRESEEELKSQSEELQRANTELEEKTESLFRQKAEIEIKNAEIEESRLDLETKAEELEEASRYKSEFLANMSHELRTPLNSMLILARMLADNDEENLSEDEVESAQVIDKVGHDLLNLINDILDLSKVEAGKLILNPEDMLLESIERQMQDQFSAVAENKGLDYIVTRDPGLPEYIHSDGQRLMQVIKNLLSNAIKFTEEGSVTLRMFKAGDDVHFTHENLRNSDSVIGFAVKDTGIGIPPEKQAAIFEAFQQADGSTSRKYGGTGLGLSISREMSLLLGGEMQIVSEAGKGATFTLYLADMPKKAANHEESDEVDGKDDISDLSESSAITRASNDTVLSVQPVGMKPDGSDRPLLIVEDDKIFAAVLKKVAESSGYECMTAHSGKDALDIAQKVHPQAVILDLGLPDMDGEQVLEQLKQQTGNHTMPVHIISGRDLDTSLLHKGATALLKKPVSEEQLHNLFGKLEKKRAHEIQKVLIIDADEESRQKTIAMLGSRGVETDVVANGHDLREALKKTQYHCLVIDIDLPDEDGTALLHELHDQLGDSMPQVIINTSREIDREEHRELAEFAGTMVMKGEHSEDRLVDEVNLFLHSIQPGKPKKPVAKPAAVDDSALKGRKILLVDDDLRNTFALSKALQKYHMDIVLADNGELALEQLEKEPDVELVLMDIMMPVMDGYEATRRIRAHPRLKNLPVIALTAKAMSDDRAKCIEAGANDYMTKPIDMEKMVAMLKLWLQQKPDDTA
ncbi:response regulator [Kistimonas asteriae]|uniref:response regulator n=1 Tax=Kistimonas asteriae TaxID=517724 RepID=UPI001BAC767E|nr:response regulator [Kistimonas asteriae]